MVGRVMTRKNVPWRGWKREKPGYHQRTVMLKKCGNKCFLGKNKTFPICKKNTCKISKKGIYAAYIRARQYKHRNISAKAKKLLKSGNK
jgi:hypothetical protein